MRAYFDGLVKPHPAGSEVSQQAEKPQMQFYEKGCDLDSSAADLSHSR